MNKDYLKSRTLWTALITALVPLFPEIEAFIVNNPKAILTGVGIVFGLLRLDTTKKLGK